MPSQTYPLFIPPEALAAKSHFEWSKQEAREYFAWLTGCRAERVQALLRFLGYSDPGLEPRDLLLRVGERVMSVVEQTDYSFIRPDGTKGLTNAGYAIAADVGLLLAQLVEGAVGDRVHWEIIYRPKRDASFHLPVLKGDGWRTCDPIEASIGMAAGCLNDYARNDDWAKTFDALVALWG